MKENIFISIQFSLKFIPKGSVDNEAALAQGMASCRTGDKPSLNQGSPSSPPYICGTRGRCVDFGDLFYLQGIRNS